MPTMGAEMNTRNMRYILLTGLLPTASAFGETALQCAALTDNVTRLACYDRIFAAQLPSSAGQEGQESKAVLNLTETVRSSLDKGEAVIVFEKGGDALP
ncbi:phospholipase, partial [Neisseria gonorrhoeae]